MKQLESFLNKYFGEKAPALPEAARKFLVAVAPWLCGLDILFGVLGILAILGIGAGTYSLFYMGAAYGSAYGAFSGLLWITVILSAVMVLFEILAFPGLMKRTYQGWQWLFYSSLVGLLSRILSFNGLVGAIIGAIIGWYFLFQIRSLYAGAPAATTPATPPQKVPPAQTSSGSA